MPEIPDPAELLDDDTAAELVAQLHARHGDDPHTAEILSRLAVRLAPGAWVIELSGGRLYADPDYDDEDPDDGGQPVHPMLYPTPAAAHAERRQLAARATDIGLRDFCARVIPRAAAAASITQPVPSLAVATLDEVHTAHPAPAPAESREWAIVLPDGRLYRDPDAVAHEQPYTAYYSHAAARDTALDLTEVEACALGEMDHEVLLITRVTSTTTTPWTLAGPDHPEL